MVETATAIRRPAPALKRMSVRTFLQDHVVQPASDEDYALSMLREQGIDIYDPAVTSRHMQHREAREYVKARAAVRREAFWRLVITGALLIMLPLLIVVGCLVANLPVLLIFGAIVALIVMGACLAISEEAQEWVSSVKVAWEDTPIDVNSKVEGMPVQVEDLLKHLHRCSPKLGFHISELKVHVRSKPELFDPIVYVSYGKSQFPIAVYDEPGFYAPLLG